MDVSGGVAGCAQLLTQAIKDDGKKRVVDHSVMAKAPRRVTVPKALRGAL
jgi:hypothetical protein